jgi:hypothetical protein
MNREHGDRAEPEEDGGTPTKIGPFSVGDPYGAGFTIPGPMTAGRPKPEPGERWTLRPGHAAERSEDPDATVPAGPVAPGRPTLLDRLLGRRSRRR